MILPPLIDGDSKNKKDISVFEDVFGNVRPEGFEPSTPRAEIWYSIQLNYGRLKGLQI